MINRPVGAAAAAATASLSAAVGVTAVAEVAAMAMVTRAGERVSFSYASYDSPDYNLIGYNTLGL